MTWDEIYNFFGIKDFIYFISSPELQNNLLPVKVVFICFTLFFFGAIIYFMLNSSYLKYKFVEDVTEFFSTQAKIMKEFGRRWARIKKRLDTGVESEFKLAVIEADDYLAESLDDRGFTGANFEDTIKKASSALKNEEDVLEAHRARNSIVYDPDFSLSAEDAKKILSAYEAAIKSLGSV